MLNDERESMNGRLSAKLIAACRNITWFLFNYVRYGRAPLALQVPPLQMVGTPRRRHTAIDAVRDYRVAETTRHDAVLTSQMRVNIGTSAVQQPVTIAVDVSGSMTGNAIRLVQNEVIRFKKECVEHPILREKLIIQMVSFGGTVNVAPFSSIGLFEPPTLSATGDTPMAEAVLASINQIQGHLAVLTDVAQLETEVPLFFMMTDGASTSSSELMHSAAEAIREIERAGRGEFYGFGVDERAVMALQPLFVRPVQNLEGVDYHKFMRIVSQSVKHVSCRKIGERRDVQGIIRGLLKGPQQ